jgi:hypothetical protein
MAIHLPRRVVDEATMSPELTIFEGSNEVESGGASAATA